MSPRFRDCIAKRIAHLTALAKAVCAPSLFPKAACVASGFAATALATLFFGIPFLSLSAFAVPQSGAEPVPQAIGGVELLPLPEPGLEHLEAAVASQLQETLGLLQSILADQGSQPQAVAEAFGTAARLFHAYDISDQAAICYTNAARLAPMDFRWVYARAVLDQQAGAIDEAIIGYRQALDLEPRYLAARVYLGEAYLAANRLEEAQEALLVALDLDSASAAAHAALGQVALSQKRYRAAAESLEKALSTVPTADRLHHPLGLAYRGLGDLERARAHLARRGPVGVRPPDPLLDPLAELRVGERVFLLRGQMAFRAGRYEAAATAFQTALEARPESVRARVNLASALAQAGRVDEAISQFRSVLDTEPDNKASLFNLGVLLAQKGDDAGAAVALEAYVAVDPVDAEVRLQLARINARLERWESAALHAGRAAELDPSNEEAHLLAANGLVRLGRYPKSRERLEIAHTLMPQSGQIAAALAKFLASNPDLKQRDGSRALDLASRVYEATGALPHAEIVALALAETGECDQAADWQRRALEAARQAEAEGLARALAATLTHLEKRPCRYPGKSE